MHMRENYAQVILCLFYFYIYFYFMSILFLYYFYCCWTRWLGWLRWVGCLLCCARFPRCSFGYSLVSGLLFGTGTHLLENKQH